jgi:hypothetical protein
MTQWEDLMQAVEQDAAEWLASSSNATNSGVDLNSKTDAS